MGGWDYSSKFWKSLGGKGFKFASISLDHGHDLTNASRDTMFLADLGISRVIFYLLQDR